MVQQPVHQDTFAGVVPAARTPCSPCAHRAGFLRPTPSPGSSGRGVGGHHMGGFGPLSLLAGCVAPIL